MSFTETEGTFVWSCDSCDTEVQLPTTTDFMSWWRALKKVGWRATKVEGEWSHSCHRCRARGRSADEIMNTKVGGRRYG